MPTQDLWRYCGKCHSMFYDGYAEKGVCPVGGGHEAQGYDFVLPYDVPASANTQDAWRYCGKCQVMFFDGYPEKGRCSAGDGHAARGFEFVLPHDVAPSDAAQDAWRYCGKCHGMFFDGYPEKGSCPAGAGHEAVGFMFVLPHAGVPTQTPPPPPPLPPPMPEREFAQPAWRYCGKCHGMFFDGYPEKGSCPAGAGHEAVGFNFYLPHDIPGTPNAQNAWRYCGKCHGMFFDGYPEKGSCPAGAGHEAQGYDFVLPHDVPGANRAQTAWRYCENCSGLFYDGYPEKGTCPAGGAHSAQGYDFALPHDIVEPLVFSRPIVSGGAAALGGSISVTMTNEGVATWQGHAHDSGADGYDFSISAVVRTPTGRAVALAHSGHVGGTFTSGSRDHDWNQPQAPMPILREHVAEFALGDVQTHLEYTSDLASSLESALGWILKFAVGTALGPVPGAVLFIGAEVGSLIATGSLVPGARVIEGILWMAGPANTLYALAADGIANAGSQSRELTPDEYGWADSQVFSGTLPPREKLLITDTIGPKNRAFTFPRFDGKITLNMGPQAFANPRSPAADPTGHTFIHELTHACQIHHSPADLSFIADAFAARVCEAVGSSPYSYPLAGVDFRTLNLEQQAQIVGDWFGGVTRAGANQTGIAKDQNSPYFRYITDNVRVGLY